jgi:hypothetical protein
MLNYTTPPAKRQKRKYTINLTNSPLLKMLLELSFVNYSISYFISLKGSLQALPIK